MRAPQIFRTSNLQTTVLAVTLVVAALLLVAASGNHQGKVSADTTLGSPFTGLTSGQLSAFTLGMMQFNVQWDIVKGLGPVYTNQDCANCHSSPVEGGTNATLRSTFFGALRSDGSFNPLTSEGGVVLQPLSVAMFRPTCTLLGEFLPRDATLVSMRVPPDLFGLGLIDNIPDSTIEAFAVDKGMGIHGTANMVTDWDGRTVRAGRFGVKAQFGSLVQAVGQAFLHDIGITNPVDLAEDCPNKPPGNPTVNKGACPTSVVPPSCLGKGEPNDPNGKETIQLFDYLVYLAPNPPNITNTNGQTMFHNVGCDLCHNPTYTTKANVQVPVNFTGGVSGLVVPLSSAPVNLYSDLLIHHLGPALADCMQFPVKGGTSPGFADGDQWRTTPLWGLSTRTTYLHDGRTTDLNTAIQMHESFAGVATACGNTYPDSEANAVVDAFNALAPQDQMDLISFIDSL